jgi:hypothetical protein
MPACGQEKESREHHHTHASNGSDNGVAGHGIPPALVLSELGFVYHYKRTHLNDEEKLSESAAHSVGTRELPWRPPHADIAAHHASEWTAG